MENPLYTPEIEHSHDNGAQGHQKVFYIGPLLSIYTHTVCGDYEGWNNHHTSRNVDALGQKCG